MCFTSSKAPPPAASWQKCRQSSTTVSAMTNFTISEFLLACRLKREYKRLMRVCIILQVVRGWGKKPLVPSRKLRGSRESARTKAWLIHRETTCRRDRFCETKTTYRARRNLEEPKRDCFPELLWQIAASPKEKLADFLIKITRR